MTASIVQQGSVRGNTSPLTLTLGAPPTQGNLLLLLITGWTETLSVPSGFTNIQTDFGSSHANEATWTYTQTVPSEPVSSPHRYWRLGNMNTSPGGGAAIAEVHLCTTYGGSTVTGSGTASASSTYSGSYLPAYAFDGNTGTFWSAAGADTSAWLEYDFGSGNSEAIVEVVLTARGDAYSSYSPTSFALQYSDDNSTWTTLESFTCAGWSAGSVQTFTIGASTSYSFTGASDYHNILLLEISGATGTVTTAYGACTNIGSSPISSGSLTAASANALRLLSFSWDSQAANPTGPPTGWAQISPSGWISPTTGGHGSAVWEIPASTSGAQAVTFSPTDSYSVVWLDVQIAGTPPPTGQRLVASFTPGSDRNNYTADLGMRFVPSIPLIVTALGVRCATGNTGNQTVILSTAAGTILASVNVPLTGGTVGTFYYAPLTSAVALSAGSTYDLSASETNGADYFSDVGPVSLNNVTSVTAIYGSPGAFATYTANTSYVGVDLLSLITLTAPPNALRLLPWQAGEIDPDLDAPHPLSLFRTRTAATIQPPPPPSTAHLTAFQAIAEVVAFNPNPPLAVAQAIVEAVASNPNPPLGVAQALVEVISLVPYAKPAPPNALRLRLLQGEFDPQDEPRRLHLYDRRSALIPAPPVQTIVDFVVCVIT